MALNLIFFATRSICKRYTLTLIPSVFYLSDSPETTIKYKLTSYIAYEILSALKFNSCASPEIFINTFSSLEFKEKLVHTEHRTSLLLSKC